MPQSWPTYGGLWRTTVWLVAHVLAARQGCTSDQCQAFALLNDANRVRSNLAERTYEFYVVRPCRGLAGDREAAGGNRVVPGCGGSFARRRHGDVGRGRAAADLGAASPRSRHRQSPRRQAAGTECLFPVFGVDPAGQHHECGAAAPAQGGQAASSATVPTPPRRPTPPARRGVGRSMPIPRRRGQVRAGR